MHLTFEQSEFDNKGPHTINKISNGLDLTQAFPSMHRRQKGNNPPSRQQGFIPRKQQNPSSPIEGKESLWDTKDKNQGRRFYNKRQVSFI